MMEFKEVLKELKNGGTAYRDGWDEPNQYIFYKNGEVLDADTDLILDDNIKKIANNNGKNKKAKDNKKTKVTKGNKGDNKVELIACLCIKTSDDRVILGWNPTYIDASSRDWHMRK